MGLFAMIKMSLHAWTDSKSLRAVVLWFTFSIKRPHLKVKIDILFVVDTTILQEWDGGQTTHQHGNIRNIVGRRQDSIQMVLKCRANTFFHDDVFTADIIFRGSIPGKHFRNGGTKMRSNEVHGCHFTASEETQRPSINEWNTCDNIFSV